jgi:hypothetical protein
MACLALGLPHKFAASEVEKLEALGVGEDYTFFSELTQDELAECIELSGLPLFAKKRLEKATTKAMLELYGKCVSDTSTLSKFQALKRALASGAKAKKEDTTARPFAKTGESVKFRIDKKLAESWYPDVGKPNLDEDGVCSVDYDGMVAIPLYPPIPGYKQQCVYGYSVQVSDVKEMEMKFGVCDSKVTKDKIQTPVSVFSDGQILDVSIDFSSYLVSVKDRETGATLGEVDVSRGKEWSAVRLIVNICGQKFKIVE